jgi:hypothetical protein
VYSKPEAGSRKKLKSAYATDFATTFAKAPVVKESFVGQRKLRRIKVEGCLATFYSGQYLYLKQYEGSFKDDSRKH